MGYATFLGICKFINNYSKIILCVTTIHLIDLPRFAPPLVTSQRLASAPTLLGSQTNPNGVHRGHPHRSTHQSLQAIRLPTTLAPSTNKPNTREQPPWKSMSRTRSYKLAATFPIGTQRSAPSVSFATYSHIRRYCKEITKSV